MAPLTHNFLVHPDNEPLVVHVPSLQALRFGSRKHSDVHDLTDYQIPSMGRCSSLAGLQRHSCTGPSKAPACRSMVQARYHHSRCLVGMQAYCRGPSQACMWQ